MEPQYPVAKRLHRSRNFRSMSSSSSYYSYLTSNYEYGNDPTEEYSSSHDNNHHHNGPPPPPPLKATTPERIAEGSSLSQVNGTDMSQQVLPMTNSSNNNTNNNNNNNNNGDLNLFLEGSQQNQQQQEQHIANLMTSLAPQQDRQLPPNFNMEQEDSDFDAFRLKPPPEMITVRPPDEAELAPVGARDYRLDELKGFPELDAPVLPYLEESERVLMYRIWIRMNVPQNGITGFPDFESFWESYKPTLESGLSSFFESILKRNLLTLGHVLYRNSRFTRSKVGSLFSTEVHFSVRTCDMPLREHTMFFRIYESEILPFLAGPDVRQQFKACVWSRPDPVEFVVVAQPPSPELVVVPRLTQTPVCDFEETLEAPSQQHVYNCGRINRTRFFSTTKQTFVNWLGEKYPKGRADFNFRLLNHGFLPKGFMFNRHKGIITRHPVELAPNIESEVTTVFYIECIITVAGKYLSSHFFKQSLKIIPKHAAASTAIPSNSMIEGTLFHHEVLLRYQLMKAVATDMTIDATAAYPCVETPNLSTTALSLEQAREKGKLLVQSVEKFGPRIIEEKCSSFAHQGDSLEDISQFRNYIVTGMAELIEEFKLHFDVLMAIYDASRDTHEFALSWFWKELPKFLCLPFAQERFFFAFVYAWNYRHKEHPRSFEDSNREVQKFLEDLVAQTNSEFSFAQPLISTSARDYCNVSSLIAPDPLAFASSGAGRYFMGRVDLRVDFKVTPDVAPSVRRQMGSAQFWDVELLILYCLNDFVVEQKNPAIPFFVSDQVHIIHFDMTSNTTPFTYLLTARPEQSKLLSDMTLRHKNMKHKVLETQSRSSRADTLRDLFKKPMPPDSALGKFIQSVMGVYIGFPLPETSSLYTDEPEDRKSLIEFSQRSVISYISQSVSGDSGDLGDDKAPFSNDSRAQEDPYAIYPPYYAFFLEMFNYAVNPDSFDVETIRLRVILRNVLRIEVANVYNSYLTHSDMCRELHLNADDVLVSLELPMRWYLHFKDEDHDLLSRKMNFINSVQKESDFMNRAIYYVSMKQFAKPSNLKFLDNKLIPLDDFDNNPLHLATISGDLFLAARLMETGLNWLCSCHNKHGEKPIDRAMRTDSLIVKQLHLLEAPLDPESHLDIVQACKYDLMCCIEKSSLDAVDKMAMAFIEAVDHRSTCSLLLLLTRAREDQFPELEKLVCKFSSEELLSATPLHFCARYRYTDVAEILCIYFPAWIRVKDECGRTPYFDAAQAGDKYCLHVMGFYAPEVVSMMDARGRLPADVAANPSCLSVVKALEARVARRTKVPLVWGIGGCYKSPSTVTPFLNMFDAIREFDLQRVKELLSKGKEPYSESTLPTDIFLNTPFHEAIELYNLPAIEALLDVASSPSSSLSAPRREHSKKAPFSNWSSDTPLHLAAKKSPSILAYLLVFDKFDINPPNKLRFTPLDVAMGLDSALCCAMMKAKGGLSNIQSVVEQSVTQTLPEETLLKFARKVALAAGLKPPPGLL